MKVTLIKATENPMDVIALAAGTSTGKVDTEHKRVSNCFKRGHMSVFEHVSFTVRIEGISRACSHQLVRHRLASYVQESQRYTKVDISKDDWYVIPPEFKRFPTFEKTFRKTMKTCAKEYELAVHDGMRKEDARYLLPEACKTAITMTMNCREFFAFLDLRTDKAAQWEIRDLALELFEVVGENGQWHRLMELWQERETTGKHVRERVSQWTTKRIPLNPR